MQHHMHIYRLVDEKNYEKKQGLNILEELSLLEYG